MESLYLELGKLIKAKRMEKSLSQDELAYRCLLHPHCIYKIEKAKSEIKLSTLIKILQELGINLNDVQLLVNKFWRPH